MRRLVGLLATSGGRVTAAQAVVSLWPDLTDAAVGYRRLRNLVPRLRCDGPAFAVRIGTDVALGPWVTCDLTDAEREGARAVATDDHDLAARVLERLVPRIVAGGPDEPWFAEATARVGRLRGGAAGALHRGPAGPRRPRRGDPPVHP